MRIILHIDINSFFASAEIIKKPKLSSYPLAVYIPENGKYDGLITSASYSAKSKGIKPPMKVKDALIIEKKLVLVESDIDYYRSLSEKFFEVIEMYISSKIEIGSIDECYLDLTNFSKNFYSLDEMCFWIQEIIYEKTKLKVNIGVGPSKFIAKLSSNINKPAGITIINNLKKSKDIFWDKSIDIIPGLGNKKNTLLNKSGVYKISDFFDKLYESRIKNILGDSYYEYKELFLLKKQSNISMRNNIPKSIGISKSFINFNNQVKIFEDYLRESSNILFNKLLQKRMVARCIYVSIDYWNIGTKSKQITLKECINNKEFLYLHIKNNFMNIFLDNYKIKKINISLKKINFYFFEDSFLKKNKNIKNIKKILNNLSDDNNTFLLKELI